MKGRRLNFTLLHPNPTEPIQISYTMARGKGNRKGASNDDLFDSDNDALDAVSESQSSATPTTSNTTETSKKPNRRKKVADVATSKPNHTSDTRKSNAEEDFDARSQLEDEQSGNTEPQDAIAAPSKKPKKKEKKRDKKEFSVPDMDFDLNLSEEAPAASNSLKSKSKKLQPMSFELLAEMESPPDTHEETKEVEVVEEFDFSIKKKKKSKGGGGGGGVEIENAGTSVVDATALEFAKSQDKKEKRGKLSKHEGGDSHSRDLPLDFKLKSRESKEARTVERVESVDGSLNDKLADESASPSKRENTSPPTSSQPALAKHSAITPGTKSRKQQSRAQTPHSTSADEIIDEKLSKHLQTHVTLSSTPTSASTTPTSASSTPKLPKNGPTASAPLKKTSDTYADTDYQEMQKKIHKPTEVSNLGDSITATGILLSHERSKDIQVDKFSLSAFGQSLITDTSLNLLFGRRYGLVGDNGSGKSTLLKCLARREIQIQSNLNIYLLEKEYDPTELTAVEAVVDIILAEKITLEQESDRLLETMDGTGSARFEEVQDRLMELDIPMAEQKARSVLHGLGLLCRANQMLTITSNFDLTRIHRGHAGHRNTRIFWWLENAGGASSCAFCAPHVFVVGRRDESLGFECGRVARDLSPLLSQHHHYGFSLSRLSQYNLHRHSLPLQQETLLIPRLLRHFHQGQGGIGRECAQKVSCR